MMMHRLANPKFCSLFCVFAEHTDYKLHFNS